MLRGGQELWELRAGQDEWGAMFQERLCQGGQGLDLEAVPWQSDWLEGLRRDVGMEGKGLFPTGCPAPSTSGLHARRQEAPLSKATAWLMRE